MSIIPWKPFSDMEGFFGNDDLFFSDTEKMKPAMDMYENEKEIIAEFNLPGIDPNKIDVSIENGFLKINGSTEEKKEEKDKGYWRREIRKGSFERMINLPVKIKEEEIDAVYEHGVLKVKMPKSEQSIPSKVSIKVK